MSEDADFAETMRVRLQADLRDAMKRRDATAVSTLRCLIAAIDNAGAVEAPEEYAAASRDWSKGSHHVITGAGPTEVARRTLTVDDVDALLRREWQARETAAATLERHGRDAGAPRAEMSIVARYLNVKPG
jgi:uncharacterized protein YqeY